VSFPSDDDFPLNEMPAAVHEGMLAVFEGGFARGDKTALFAAIQWCAMTERPMPKWLADAVREAWDEVISHRAKSWNDVLGPPRPKGVHREDARRRSALRFKVYARVDARLREGAATNPDLFDEVGRTFTPPIGHTLCEELYREVARVYRAAHDEEVPIL
jgi:hypothetical protein